MRTGTTSDEVPFGASCAVVVVAGTAGCTFSAGDGGVVVPVNVDDSDELAVEILEDDADCSDVVVVSGLATSFLFSPLVREETTREHISRIDDPPNIFSTGTS